MFCINRIVCYRFTPTCVGKTFASNRALSHSRVHPHVCGENMAIYRRAFKDAGSPPRVWGKPKPAVTANSRNGFTPTCVGKTTSAQQAIARREVHPHVCGENFEARVCEPLLAGSPPRVWGKRGGGGGRRKWRRGSPPRVWGKRCVRPYPDRLGWFTPTCVGKTSLNGSSEAILAVHPHVCGENHIGRGLYVPTDGSPPRVWGKHEVPETTYRLGRFTPTCVGKTAGNMGLRKPSQVHPHVCGENEARRRQKLHAEGSPPRVWGKRR